MTTNNQVNSAVTAAALSAPKYSPDQVTEMINKVKLPPAIFGRAEFARPSEILGGAQSAISVANGQGRTLGVCALLCHYWHGSASLSEIQTGLKTDLRAAFEAAALSLTREKGAMPASAMLEGLRAFVRVGLEAATKPVAKPVAPPVAPAVIESPELSDAEKLAGSLKAAQSRGLADARLRANDAALKASEAAEAAEAAKDSEQAFMAKFAERLHMLSELALADMLLQVRGVASCKQLGKDIATLSKQTKAA